MVLYISEALLYKSSSNVLFHLNEVKTLRKITYPEAKGIANIYNVP